MSSRKEEITIADGLIKIDIEVDGKQITVASNALDNLEAAALRSGKGTKAASDGMNDLGSSGAKAGKDLTSASGAVDSLASASTGASKNVAGAASNLGDLGNISSSTSKNLEGTNLVIGDIAGGSTAASKSITGTVDNLADLGSISSTAGSNLQNTNLVIGDIAGGSTAASEGIKGASDSLNNLGGSADKAANSAGRAAQETENVGNASGKASIGIKELAVSLGLVAVATAAFNILKSSVDTAIARFDTLNTFPSVLQALGVSAEDAERAMSRLSDGIDGLPTTLNDIAANAQRMYTSFNDMDEAADTAIALNNAMLGSGASAADAQRGTEQYLQVLQKGKFEMEEWKTLQETMDVGLVKVAESMGYVGKTAKSDLYEALKYGEVSIEDFNNKLIELGTGTGIMAKLAKENSLGLATSIGNLKNAAARGIANIIDSFNRLTKEVTGKDIAQNIDSLKAIVNSSFNVIGSVIEGTAPTVKFFASTVQDAIPVVQALTPAIIGLMVAYGTYTVISKATIAIQASNTVLMAAQASQKALTVAVVAQTAAQARQTGTITASNLVIGVLTGRITVATAATVAKTTATYAWGAALRFMAGPVGWIVTGLGLLTTAIIATVKWLKKSTEEGERLNQQNEMLANSTESLKTNVEESSKAYEKNQAKIETNAEAYAELAAKAEELAAKEKLTGEEKKTLNSYIEELNRNVDGLNLAYGEQSNALSATSEQILNRINLMKEEEKLQGAQERLTEIMKEQIEIGKQQEEITALREEWNQKLEDGSVKGREHKAALEELEAQEISLSAANKLAGEERLNLEQQIIESSAAVAAAAEQDTGRQMLMLDELSKSQQETVESMKSTWDDYASAATDMFDTISTKSELSVSEMTKNLEKNQEIITKWSENIAKLAERGIDEGLLNTLRDAGPESAGHVNALVKASDTELQKLSDAFANGGDVATQALVKSMGIEDSGVMGAIGHLVVDTEQALAQSIKNAGFEGIGNAVPEGFAEGIKGGSKEVESASKKMADDTTKAAKGALDINSPSGVFKTIGSDVTDGFALGINDGTAKVIEAIQRMFRSVQVDSKQNFDNIVKDYDAAVGVVEKTLEKLPKITQEAMKKKLDELKKGAKTQVEAMKQLALDLLNPFKNTPSQFETIGRESMAGFNRGLKAGEARVMTTARSIANSVANTMRKALDIHSPSRVMEEIGKWIGIGLADGIESQKSHVEKSMEDLGYLLIDVMDHFKSEEVKINKNASAEIAKIEKRSAEDIAKIHSTAKAKKRKLTQQEAIRIQRIEEDSAKKIADIQRKATKDSYNLMVQADKEMLKEIKLFIDNKKSLEELTLAEEAKIWKASARLFSDGTKEKVEAQKAYKKSAEELNKEIEKINKEHMDRIAKINDELAEGERKLTEEYNKAYSDRIDSLTSFAGIFDEFVDKFEGSGDTLLWNLETQVEAFEEWREVIASLWGKIDNQALMKELEGLGPKAVGELRALNGLSESELARYVELYNQKFSLARDQANVEMAGLKEDTEIRINEMRESANAELDIVYAEWNAKIQDLVKATDTELKALKTVGRQAGQGLLDGLESMEPALMATARRIANNIKATIQAALDINSPSRVMRDEVGRWIPEGIALGIRENAKSVYSELENMANNMIIPATPEQALGTSRMAYNGGLNRDVGSITTSTDNRKTYSPTFQNYFTSDESTPSEAARQQKQQSQRQAMEWGLI